jgi:hypothetical protein
VLQHSKHQRQYLQPAAHCSTTVNENLLSVLLQGNLHKLQNALNKCSRVQALVQWHVLFCTRNVDAIRAQELKVENNAVPRNVRLAQKHCWVSANAAATYLCLITVVPQKSQQLLRGVLFQFRRVIQSTNSNAGAATAAAAVGQRGAQRRS